MKLKDIFSDNKTRIFVVTTQDDEDELNWTIEPTNFDLLPEEENIYYVKAYQVSTDSTSDCYLGIITPERIAETVVKREPSGQIVAESIYDQEQTIIPAVASDCFGPVCMPYSERRNTPRASAPQPCLRTARLSPHLKRAMSRRIGRLAGMAAETGKSQACMIERR